jgi:hypothetical protein
MHVGVIYTQVAVSVFGHPTGPYLPLDPYYNAEKKDSTL